MARSVRCLPHMHEDLSSIASTHMQSWLRGWGERQENIQNEKKILYELFYGLTRVVFPKSFPIAVTKELGKSQSREKGVIWVSG